MDPKSDLEGECVLARFRSVLFQLCTPVSEPVTVSGMDVQLRSRPVGGKGESGGGDSDLSDQHSSRSVLGVQVMRSC